LWKSHGKRIWLFGRSRHSELSLLLAVHTVYPLPCRESELPRLDRYVYIRRKKSSASKPSSFKFLGDVVGLCTSLLENLILVAAVFFYRYLGVLLTLILRHHLLKLYFPALSHRSLAPFSSYFKLSSSSLKSKDL
jgi:hypothetical protein